MYGKFFASAFTGSMYGAGPDVFAVWGYVIANTVDAQIELNPHLIAGMIGMTPERASAAIDYLCAPDTNSRSKAEGGRRLVQEGEIAYRVVNHSAYRSIRSEDDRRAYNCQKQREHRARVKASVNTPVNDSQSLSAQAEAEAVSSKQKQRQNQKHTEAAGAASAVDGGFPELSSEGNQALQALARASRNPTAWVAEVRAWLDGMRGKHYPPNVVSRALWEMTVAGTEPNARALAGFLRKAALPEPIEQHPGETAGDTFIRMTGGPQ
jgi:hypothetical protein